MDYEKKYKEALERAKEFHKSKEGIYVLIAETIFPELRESEDERIIEEIKFAIMQMPSEREDTKQRCLAYLEKQKESLPISETCKENADSFTEDERIKKHIVKFIDEQYPTHGNLKEEKDKMLAYIEKQKVQNEITIEQVYKEFITPEKLKDAKTNKYIRAQLLWELMHNGIITEVDYQYLTDDKRKPWTAEEYQKEQKPVECIEFDNEFEKQVSHLLASVLNGEWEYDEGFVKHAAQSLLGYAKNELKLAANVQKINPNIVTETHTDGTVELDGKALLYTADKSYQIGFRDGVASVKQEWVLPEDFEEAVYKVANFISPFDNQEELRKTSHRFAEQLLSLAKKELDNTTECSKVTINGEPIPTETKSVDIPLAEWSKEDEEMRGTCIDFLEHFPRPCGEVIGPWKDCISWLKSLPLKCPKTSDNWKPSNEQMEALKKAVNKLTKTDVADSVRLSIMYDNLKRLI